MKPKPEILTQCGGRIRASRRGAGLTLEQAARLTGISSNALSLIETGKRDLRLTTLSRIATALHVDLARLLEDHPGRQDDQPDPAGPGYDLGGYT